MKAKLLVATIAAVFIVAVPSANGYLLCCESPPANYCAPQDGDWTPYVHVLGRSFSANWYYHSGDSIIMNYGTYKARFTCVWNRYQYDVRWRLDYWWQT